MLYLAALAEGSLTFIREVINQDDFLKEFRVSSVYNAVHRPE